MLASKLVESEKNTFMRLLHGKKTDKKQEIIKCFPKKMNPK